MQSYAKHDCRLVCALNELDVVGVAHSFGLIRLPKMSELSNRDLSAFEVCIVDAKGIVHSVHYSVTKT